MSVLRSVFLVYGEALPARQTLFVATNYVILYPMTHLTDCILSSSVPFTPDVKRRCLKCDRNVTRQQSALCDDCIHTLVGWSLDLKNERL